MNKFVTTVFIHLVVVYGLKTTSLKLRNDGENIAEQLSPGVQAPLLQNLRTSITRLRKVVVVRDSSKNTQSAYCVWCIVVSELKLLYFLRKSQFFIQIMWNWATRLHCNSDCIITWQNLSVDHLTNISAAVKTVWRITCSYLISYLLYLNKMKDTQTAWGDLFDCLPLHHCLPNFNQGNPRKIVQTTMLLKLSASASSMSPLCSG